MAHLSANSNGEELPPKTKEPRRSGAAKWEERRPKKDHHSLAESSKCVQINVAFIPAFAGRLRVEQFVGLVGLVERPAMGEQRLDIDAAIGDEAGAFLLADRGEGPRRDDRELLPQHVGINSNCPASADVGPFSGA